MNPYIEISDRKIGRDYPPLVIAEIGINHNGSLDFAKQLIDVAKSAGCDAVKFQKRTISKVYSKNLKYIGKVGPKENDIIILDIEKNINSIVNMLIILITNII